MSKTLGFFEKVYQIVSLIPAGRVMTYGQIADLLGTKDARRVGHALHANRSPVTPCHRVVNKDGGLAASYAFGGDDVQKTLLKSEGITFKGDRVNLMKHILYLKSSSI